MISQTVEYALRAVVTIAQYDGEPCTAQQISEITHVPAPYLSKLMQGLVRAGIARSQRGVHGGYLLTREPRELSTWEIVDAVEPLKRIRTCPLEIETHSPNLCPLHRHLDRVMETVEKMFQDITVADLLAEPGSVTPLCEKKKLMTINTHLAKKRNSKKPTIKRSEKKKS